MHGHVCCKCIVIVLALRELLSDDAPVVSILKCLTLRGWSPGPAPTEHTNDSEKCFGVRQFVTFRAYLQCLIQIDVLRQQGLTHLKSQQKPVYYQCVLCSNEPATVLTDQPDTYYNSLLRGAASAAIEDDASDCSDPVMSSCVGPVPKKPRVVGKLKPQPPECSQVGHTLPTETVISMDAVEQHHEQPMSAAALDTERTDGDVPIISYRAEPLYVPLESGFFS